MNDDRPVDRSRTDRGASGIIGTLVMVTLGLVVAAVLATAIFGAIAAMSNADVPQAQVEIEDATDNYKPSDGTTQALLTLRHERGDDIDMDDITLVVRTESDNARVFSWETGAVANHVGTGNWTTSYNGGPLTLETLFTRDDQITISYRDDGQPDQTVTDDTNYVVMLIHTKSGSPVEEVTVTVN